VEKQHHIHASSGGIHPIKAQDSHAVGVVSRSSAIVIGLGSQPTGLHSQ
jgi:hypothetical protein